MCNLKRVCIFINSLRQIDMDNHQQRFQAETYVFNHSRYNDRTPDFLIHRALRNQKELTKLINCLFEHHSRLLVVRIDLGYVKDSAGAISLEIAQRHREQLLTDRRNLHQVFNGLVGHAWGFELGEQKGGYHYHLLAIFDGSRRRDGVGICMAISDLWGEITGGHGRCYICNFDKKK